MKHLIIPFQNRQAATKNCLRILLSIYLICAMLPLGWSSDEDEKLVENLALFSQSIGVCPTVASRHPGHQRTHGRCHQRYASQVRPVQPI